MRLSTPLETPRLRLRTLTPDDGRHVGNIKLGPINRHHRRGDIGLLIGERDQWGRGLAAEAIAAMTAYAFAELGLNKVVAGCYAANEGSRRAFLKAGFAEVARRPRPRHWLSDGVWQDDVVLECFAPARD
ncbi:MAG: GNAT family N-acetyltransferase [Rhodospirillales bacterium]|nr:GNAT family N-acetyltransferase [Rhodospirillales bacterium]